MEGVANQFLRDAKDPSAVSLLVQGDPIVEVVAQSAQLARFRIAKQCQRMAFGEIAGSRSPSKQRLPAVRGRGIETASSRYASPNFVWSRVSEIFNRLGRRLHHDWLANYLCIEPTSYRDLMIARRRIISIVTLGRDQQADCRDSCKARNH